MYNKVVKLKQLNCFSENYLYIQELNFENN